MNALAEARMRVCRTCEHRRTAYAGHWQWPHCLWSGSDHMSMELSPDFLEHAVDLDCPDGRWSGLEPIDREAEAAANEARAREAHREFVRPYLDAALSRIPAAEDKAAYLVELVAAAKLRRDIAEERAAQEGLPLD